MTEWSYVDRAETRKRGARAAFFLTHPDADDQKFEAWLSQPECDVEGAKLFEHNDKVRSACAEALAHRLESQQIDDVTMELAYAEAHFEAYREVFGILSGKFRRH